MIEFILPLVQIVVVFLCFYVIVSKICDCIEKCHFYRAAALAKINRDNDEEKDEEKGKKKDA